MGIDSALFMGLSLISIWGGFAFFLSIALRKM
ncbi:MetS family NSS transporter small subunit [uncultured Brachyspira sp.]|nr:MetS family NSS transporter small subunit [uncultured Brachyspira sp.]